MKLDIELMNITQMTGTLKNMAPELSQATNDYNEKVDPHKRRMLLSFVLYSLIRYPHKRRIIAIADIVLGKKAEITSKISKFSCKLIRVRCLKEMKINLFNKHLLLYQKILIIH